MSSGVNILWFEVTITFLSCLNIWKELSADLDKSNKTFIRSLLSARLSNYTSSINTSKSLYGFQITASLTTITNLSFLLTLCKSIIFSPLFSVLLKYIMIFPPYSSLFLLLTHNHFLLLTSSQMTLVLIFIRCLLLQVHHYLIVNSIPQNHIFSSLSLVSFFEQSHLSKNREFMNDIIHSFQFYFCSYSSLPTFHLSFWEINTPLLSQT